MALEVNLARLLARVIDELQIRIEFSDLTKRSIAAFESGMNHVWTDEGLCVYGDDWEIRIVKLGGESLTGLQEV